ncbi:hydroxyectoine utilization dehydratase EutB [Pseudomonas putida]|uniref:hydroxyectoine utilization dehydratase EutB n=1 Tax=Pseudomonas putida TaxID=303 RepID=UPI00300ECE10
MPSVYSNDILAARGRITGLIQPTPMARSASLSERLQADVFLKLECRQLTGSFKVRGAFNAVARLSDAARERGVVTASTGNHGKALAYVCARLGVKVTVCLSSLVPSNKVRAIRHGGAELIMAGSSQNEALQYAMDYASASGAIFIPPFDHPDIIAGQGTLGLEIVEQCPVVQEILVPLSGGGLFSGVALAAKHADPAIRLHGVSMQRGAAMQASLAAGRPVNVEESPTLADSLGGGIGLDNRYTFALTRELCDRVHLVDEPAIACAMRHLHHQEGQTVEGAAAVGVAALLQGLIQPKGPVVVVISGSNVDDEQLLRVLSGAHK